LLVDDEYDITLAFKIVSEESGFAVDSFNDSILALMNFKAGIYDLLLLDIKIPKMNDFELRRQLKR
jgi:DNA-binding response OmpR family regulator